MGVQGPGPFHYGALKALCPELVFPILSLIDYAPCLRTTFLHFQQPATGRLSGAISQNNVMLNRQKP
jgi:hypothetical protein